MSNSEKVVPPLMRKSCTRAHGEASYGKRMSCADMSRQAIPWSMDPQACTCGGLPRLDLPPDEPSGPMASATPAAKRQRLSRGTGAHSRELK